MKYIFTVCLFLSLGNAVQAQSFTVINDTIQLYAAPGNNSSFDSIAIGSSFVGFNWHIIDCNFPPGWQTASVAAFCDDVNCTGLSVLWPSADVHATSPYAAGDTGALKLALYLADTAMSGCYYVTVRLHDTASYADSITETWTVCYYPESIPSLTSGNAISIYPNPAINELHLQLGTAVNVQEAAIYDVLGKLIRTIGCTIGDDKITLDGISPGVYFARFLNSNGATVNVIRFVKQ